ncbi:MAG: hypothetical protein M0Z38_05160 [Deltaproteobacteria bacterium]|nr:hypothetical protein [Deltaproteobacteria bacterium]
MFAGVKTAVVNTNGRRQTLEVAPDGLPWSNMPQNIIHGRFAFPAIILLLLFRLPACGWGGSGQVVITGKTVYAGMAIEEVRVRVLRLDGDHWKESSSGRSGYHGSFIVKTKPGMIRLEARGEIFKDNRKIPLAGRVTALEVPSDIRRMDRIVIELAPVSDKPERQGRRGSRAWAGVIRPPGRDARSCSNCYLLGAAADMSVESMTDGVADA